MTLAQLKRILQPGATLTLTYTMWGKNKIAMVGMPRKVLATQTNGLTLENPERPGQRGSFLEYPKASLCTITDDTLTIYEPGIRSLTPSECTIVDNVPSYRKENEELSKRDLMTDGAQTYWMDKQYIKDHDAQWYWGWSKGLRFVRAWASSPRGVMYDKTIKGKKSLVYTFSAKS